MMTAEFSIDPRPLGLHLRPVNEHWRPTDNKLADVANVAAAAYAARPQRQMEEARALFSLAMQQRRQSHQYRQWAREYTERGEPDLAERWQAEADEYLRNARWHLTRARAKGL